VEDITQEAMDALSRYDWPGNVRELRNCVESVIAKTQGRVISADMLPESIRPADTGRVVGIPVGTSMQEAEMRMIKATLAHTGGNQTQAARILQIGLRTLQRKIKQYGI
jgi:DNA-binding NtrC family response regulator